jgi:hypothetical protein
MPSSLRSRFVLRLEKTLPGELEGKVNPEDYGFDTIHEEPPNDQEAAERVSRLYEQVKERTGVEIPAIDRYLDEASAREGDTGTE